jgi:pyruvate,water dikinase
LRALPDGERKSEEAKRMIDRVRTFIGYREPNRAAVICAVVSAVWSSRSSARA